MTLNLSDLSILGTRLSSADTFYLYLSTFKTRLLWDGALAVPYGNTHYLKLIFQLLLSFESVDEILWCDHLK